MTDSLENHRVNEILVANSLYFKPYLESGRRISEGVHPHKAREHNKPRALLALPLRSPGTALAPSAPPLPPTFRTLSQVTMEELIMAGESLKLSFRRYTLACSATTEIHSALNSERDSVALGLAGCITREIQALADYQNCIPNLRITLTRCRNPTAAIVPISTLPSEILARIFELVHGSWIRSIGVKRNEYGVRESPESSRTMPPVVLSHVCAHWRQLALGLPVLWSHDHTMTPHLRKSSLKRFMDRGRVLAERRGSLNTSLHIDIIPSVILSPPSNAIRLGKLYTGTGNGLQKLRLDNWTYKDVFRSVLVSSLTSIPRKALKQLVLVNHQAKEVGILTNDTGVEALDHYLRSITTLYLIDTRLPWLSSAYSGLSDLRLLASGAHRDFSISISQLIAILSSSPGLRILHFNHQVNLEGRNLSNIARVALEDLEDLNIRGMPNDCERILGLFSPGSKPMSLSISADPKINPTGSSNSIPAAVLAFLERSNVVELYIECPAQYRSFSFSGLSSGPLDRLRILGLKRFRLDEMIHPEPMNRKQSWSNQLDLLHLHDCVIYPQALLEFARVCPIGALNLCECSLIKGNADFAVHLGRWNFKLKEFVKLIPKIKFVDPPELCRIGEWRYWEVPGAQE